MTSKQIYRFLTTGLIKPHQWPIWTNQPKRAPDTHRYWRDTVPPGPHAPSDIENYGIGSGFPEGMERPSLVFEKLATSSEFVDVIPATRDLWIMSQRAKDVMERADRDGFEFREASTFLGNGSPGPQYWVVDIIRTLDAINEERSEVSVSVHPNLITGKPMRSVSYGVRDDLVFNAQIVDDFRVFRPKFSRDVFCDAVTAAAITESKITGLTTTLSGRTDD